MPRENDGIFFMMWNPLTRLRLIIGKSLENRDLLSAFTFGDREWTTQGSPRHHRQPLRDA